MRARMLEFRGEDGEAFYDLVAKLTGLAGVVLLVAISACLSLMFPTIYGLAIGGLGEDTKIAASGLIMAILGGALLTAVMGQVSDSWGIHAAFAVPLVCFLIIARYGMTIRRATRTWMAASTR